MKRYLFYGLIAAIGLTIASCKKDTGNYDYHDINKITFSDIDTVKGYQVLFGNVLKVTPTLKANMDADGTGNYTYQWSWALVVATGGFRDSVIATTKDLSVPVSLAPGIYNLQYRVTDNNTGVTFRTRAKVNVTTEVYEGYMVLNDVNGQSRLDMVSYNQGANTFTPYIDVLKKMNSTMPMTGKPYQVFCMLYNSTPPPNYGIFVLTSTGCNRIDQETFAYMPSSNIRNMFVGNVPADFAPQRMAGEVYLNSPTAGYSHFLLFGNNNVYSYHVFNGRAFRYAPLNVYTASGTPFNVAPYGVTNGNAVTMYNSDKKNFVTAGSYSATSLTDVASGFKYPTGLNMVFMDKDYNNNTFAILKDPVTSNMYLFRAPIAGISTYFEQIVGTDIGTATNFAVSPVYGYLFYSSGGKVYEYDPSLKTSTLMVDKGASQISHLSFQRFFNRTTSTVNKANYAIWSNYLSVGSYNPAGAADGNGTLELYSVPSLNGQIKLEKSWNGFGKIVSISYRER